MLNTESKHACPDWVRAAVTEQDFLLEQAQLSQVWTFVGYVQDIPDNNDWMRVDLAGRSVIVQRFGTTIRAFENVCQHRFHPIHVAPRGNGPLRCGFHGWQYDQEGRAAMVPKCREMFGCTPDALQMRLNTLEVDTCGSLIFARFGTGPGLREWLAGSFDIMQYLTRAAVKDGEVSQLVDSHWKFMLEITLDDYHVVAVHPQSFGKNGHTPMSRINYYRMGEHSALIPSGRPDSIEKIVAECQAGQFVPFGYMIFQIFPTLVFVVFHAINLFGDSYWFGMTEHMQPQTHKQTRITSRYYMLPLPEAGWWRRTLRAFLKPFILFFVKRSLNRIFMEDHTVCMHQQTVAHQVRGERRISAQETRVSWFAETYARFVRFK